jgi:hypothetical protein
VARLSTRGRQGYIRCVAMRCEAQRCVAGRSVATRGAAQLIGLCTSLQTDQDLLGVVMARQTWRDKSLDIAALAKSVPKFNIGVASEDRLAVPNTGEAAAERLNSTTR